MAAPVPDAEVAKAYNSALSNARTWARGDADRVEAFTDAATDAVVWAVANCNNADTFGAFARSAVRRFLWRTSRKLRQKAANRPAVQSLVNEDPAGREGKPTRPILIEELPEELAVIVRFYFDDGYDLRQIALLTGLSFKTVQRRLQAAGEMIAEGRMKPDRKSGERRLSAG